MRADRLRLSNCLRSRHPLAEASLLIGLTLIAAAASWLLRAPRLPLIAESSRYALDLGFPLLSPSEAVKRYEGNYALIVDTRPGSPAQRIPGALPIRAERFDDDLRELLDFVTPADPLILVGDGDLRAAAIVAERFAARGYHELSLMGREPHGVARCRRTDRRRRGRPAVSRRPLLPAWLDWPLRLVIGGVFVYASLDKIAHPDPVPRRPPTITASCRDPCCTCSRSFCPGWS